LADGATAYSTAATADYDLSTPLSAWESTDWNPLRLRYLVLWAGVIGPPRRRLGPPKAGAVAAWAVRRPAVPSQSRRRSAQRKACSELRCRRMRGSSRRSPREDHRASVSTEILSWPRQLHTVLFIAQPANNCPIEQIPLPTGFLGIHGQGVSPQRV